MSTHGRSGIARWALGSVTDKVIHTSTSPLLIIRSQEQEKASRGSASSAEAKLDTLIVPLDGSPLAEQVLPHTVALAKALALRVLLVRVPFVPIAGYLPGYKDLPEIEEAQAKEYLYKVSGNLGQQGLPSVEVRLLHGNAAGAIVDLARETPNSLVTMTTHGRSGVGRWVLGSVTGRVVRHSGVPVLVVH
jgi:nucleotide-binding universal stress UspA family protein